MTQAESAPPRVRTGGRAGRAATRAASAHAQGPAYIERAIPPYELFDADAVSLVESKADQILGEVGMEIRGDDEALQLFRAAGAKVTGLNVRFQPGQVRELCATAPAQFTQHARNSSRSVQIGGSNLVLAPTYGSPFVRDLPGGRRYGTIADFQNFVKLSYTTPWLHHSGGTVCEPTDVAVNKRHLDMVYAHLRYGDKGFMGSVTAPERAADSIEMARIEIGRAHV